MSKVQIEENLLKQSVSLCGVMRPHAKYNTLNFPLKTILEQSVKVVLYSTVLDKSYKLAIESTLEK